MKILLKTMAAITILIFASISIEAQVPQGINYQAVLRNASGQIMQNQNATVKFTIHQAAPNGTIVYEETQGPLQTNNFGLVNLQMGQGAPSIGIFSTIQWGTNSYFLQVWAEIGMGYVDLGTTQFISVPYAMVADTVLHNGSGDNWGSQTVVKKSPLSGGGITGDSLKITPGQNTQVLSTNSLGNVVWRNTTFLNGCGTGTTGNGYVPTSWDVLDFSTWCSLGNTTNAHLFLQFYSATARTLYLRQPGMPNQDQWVIVDIAAGRTVLVAVQTINGQIEWYSSTNSAITYELVGIGR